MTLEDVKKALDMNPNLTDELRDNIFGLINIFNSKYPDISLNNLVNNLQTLNIVKSNKFVNKRISKYNFLTNTIEFNLSKIEEGYDMKHMLMYELLNVITNNGKMVGFNLNDKYRALNAGYTDTFRFFYPDKTDIYSWWSYRFKAREKNAGWRIDYFITSKSLNQKLKDAKIHTDVEGSDHCPVELQIDL